MPHTVEPSIKTINKRDRNYRVVAGGLNPYSPGSKVTERIYRSLMVTTDNLEPKGEGGLISKINLKKRGYSQWIYNEVIQPGYEIIQKGLHNIFQNVKSDEERAFAFGMYVMNIDQKYAKGFTYGFTNDYAVNKGFVDLIADDQSKELSDRQYEWVKRALNVRLERLKSIFRNKEMNVDFVQGFLNLPNDSHAGYPLRKNWSFKMTKSEIAAMNGAIDLGGGLTFDLRGHISSWDAFVWQARTFLTTSGVESAKLKSWTEKTEKTSASKNGHVVTSIVETTTNNYDYLTLKELVLYLILKTPNFEKVLLEAYQRIDYLYGQGGRRIQGGFDKDNPSNDYNVSKIRTFIMVPVLDIIINATIRDELQRISKDNDILNCLWRDDFSKVINEALISQKSINGNVLESGMGGTLIESTVADLTSEDVLNQLPKDMRDWASKFVASDIIYSLDYSQFDRGVASKIQEYILQNILSAVELTAFKTPLLKQWTLDVLTKAKELRGKGVRLIIPAGSTSKEIISNIARQKNVQWATYEFRSLLASGEDYTSFNGSYLSSADTLELLHSLGVNSDQIQVLSTLGDDVIVSTKLNNLVPALKKAGFPVTHKGISDYAEKFLAEFRNATVNAKKAVSTYAFGIILQTLVLPFKGIHGYYIMARVNNSFAPEDYPKPIKGITNNAAAQAISLVMQIMNLYRGEGIDDNLLDKYIRDPWLEKRLPNTDYLLLSLINLYIQRLNKSVDSLDWFFMLIRQSGGADEAKSLLMEKKSYLSHGSDETFSEVIAELREGRLTYKPLINTIRAIGRLARKMSFSQEDWKRAARVYTGADRSLLLLSEPASDEGPTYNIVGDNL